MTWWRGESHFVFRTRKPFSEIDELWVNPTNSLCFSLLWELLRRSWRCHEIQQRCTSSKNYLGTCTNVILGHTLMDTCLEPYIAYQKEEMRSSTGKFSHTCQRRRLCCKKASCGITGQLSSKTTTFGLKGRIAGANGHSNWSWTLQHFMGHVGTQEWCKTPYLDSWHQATGDQASQRLY
jgi:hypothetical protein